MKIKALKFNVIGDISKLPEESQIILRRVMKNTEKNTGIVLTLALIYGGQDEILRACKKIIKD
jgi:undecaprenyl diphosphate synthase